MKRLPLRSLSIVLLIATALAAISCAKKQPIEPPPAPPSTPSEPTTPPPPPPAPPSETPTTPPLSANDFQPVFFDLDSDRLREDARVTLDRNAKLMRDNAGLKVTIEGHCDERGTAEYNQALGERRAQAARDYLTAAGIGADRMTTISYGKERPFDAGHDESAWAQNRRAHFVIGS